MSEALSDYQNSDRAIRGHLARHLGIGPDDDTAAGMASRVSRDGGAPDWPAPGDVPDYRRSDWHVRACLARHLGIGPDDDTAASMAERVARAAMEAS